MKKILFAVCAVLFVFCSCKKINTADIYGTWKSGTLFEKYQAGGTGYTWDGVDDVSEEEAQSFTWEIDEKAKTLTQYHQMESSTGLVPKSYTIKTLTETSLVYTANGKTYTFVKY